MFSNPFHLTCLRKPRRYLVAKIQCYNRFRCERSFTDLYFFRTKGKDTVAEVNRTNSIISTNWILNIDKRLPLRLVIKEVIKLQEKKRNEVAHKNELAQNYYSYADSIGKNIGFLSFTKVYYKMEKPKFGVVIFFAKTNKIQVNSFTIERIELQEYLNNMPSDKPNKFQFCFAKDMSYGNYIQNEIFIRSLKIDTNEEFVC